MTVLLWMHAYTVTLLQGVTSKRICTCKEVHVHAFIRLSIELSQVTDIFNIIHVHDNVQKAGLQKHFSFRPSISQVRPCQASQRETRLTPLSERPSRRLCRTLRAAHACLVMFRLELWAVPASCTCRGAEVYVPSRGDLCTGNTVAQAQLQVTFAYCVFSISHSRNASQLLPCLRTGNINGFIGEAAEGQMGPGNGC